VQWKYEVVVINLSTCVEQPMIMKYVKACVTMRVNGVLTWLLVDQVGSTTITANADGSFQSEIRYSAYGEVRYANGTTVTDKLYTGQQQETEIGLDYYVARFYDPVTAHFIQPDTMVPEPGTLKAFDRYAYAANNPINFNDPNGHCYAMVNGQLTDRCKQYWIDYTAAMQKKYGVIPTTQPTPVTKPKENQNALVMCGSTGNLAEEGPACPASGSMSVWTQQNAPSGYTILSPQIQYPGVGKVPGYDGKAGQAQRAIDNLRDPLPDILIGFSAGADSAVLYTQMAANNNLTALVLIGPALDSTGVSKEDYVNMISNLGINVLIVDETGTLKNLFAKAENVTVIQTGVKHPDMDDDIGIMSDVYKWLNDPTVFKKK
jgi:RHS repeat-associated protein